MVVKRPFRPVANLMHHPLGFESGDKKIDYNRSLIEGQEVGPISVGHTVHTCLCSLSKQALNSITVKKKEGICSSSWGVCLFFVTIKMTFVTQNVWGAQGEKEDLGKKPQG